MQWNISQKTLDVKESITCMTSIVTFRGIRQKYNRIELLLLLYYLLNLDFTKAYLNSRRRWFYSFSIDIMFINVHLLHEQLQEEIVRLSHNVLLFLYIFCMLKKAQETCVILMKIHTSQVSNICSINNKFKAISSNSIYRNQYEQLPVVYLRL